MMRGAEGGECWAEYWVIRRDEDGENGESEEDEDLRRLEENNDRDEHSGSDFT